MFASLASARRCIAFLVISKARDAHILDCECLQSPERNVELSIDPARAETDKRLDLKTGAYQFLPEFLGANEEARVVSSTGQQTNDGLAQSDHHQRGYPSAVNRIEEEHSIGSKHPSNFANDGI